MTFRLPGLARAATLAAALIAACATHAVADDGFSAAQREGIEKIVREYLVSHPEVLQEAYAELEKRQSLAEAKKQQEGVAKNTEAIFNSPHDVVLGNPKGDVTFVEFFDYNCGYCKRAMGDMLTLLKDDPKLRIVLKEFPVLGPGSIEAAQVAAAVHLQDPTGKKYLDFHQRLLGGRGQADRAHALAAAKDAGLDVARIEKDLKDPKIIEMLQSNVHLGEALGINGTPSYIIGKEIAIGAVGLETLRAKVAEARCGKAAC